MNSLSLDSPLLKLELDPQVIIKLNNHNIKTVKDLWEQKRTNLKIIGLTPYEINHIIIKLQLYSLDLNKKIYSKN